MREEVFEIVLMALRVVLMAVTVFLLPKVKAWIEANTTEKERKDAIFWTQLAVKAAEEIYKERGQGKLKKEEVTKWLNKTGVKIRADQLDTLIDTIVEEFNKHGWDTVIATAE